MKKILFCSVLSFCSLLVLAQPGCPDVNAGPDQTLPCGTNCTNITTSYFNVGATSAYEVSQIPYAPPFPYSSGTPVLVHTDDLWSSVVTLPFNFCFFSTTYNQLIVGSNGTVSFDLSHAGLYNTWPIGGAVPAAPADLDASIMGVWEDIDPTYKGSTQYQIGGVSPCRYFKVSWDSVPYYGDPNSAGPGTCGKHWASTEIVLYETTNVIEIYIREKQLCSGWNGGLAVEGIVNPANTIAYTVPGRNATQWTANNDAWRFTPSGPSIVSVKLSTGGNVIDTAATDTVFGTESFTYNVCPPANATTTYTATATYHRCDGTVVTKTDAMNITTSPSPVAGPDQNLGCLVTGLTTTMAANAFAGASWTALSSNPVVTTIANASSPTTGISGFTANGTYGYLWGAGACKDTVLLIVSSSSNAGPDQNICQGGAATMAATGTGTWSAVSGNPGTASITNTTSPTTTITSFLAPGTYGFQWVNGNCKDTALVIVTPKPNAGPDQTICEYTTATLAATGTGTWSTPATGNPSATTITTPASATTTVTGFTAAGAYYYIWTVNGCTDTMIVNVTAKPNAGPDQTICEYTTAALAAIGTGTWSTPATGNPSATTITTPSSGTTTVTGFTAAGAYSYIWTVNGCTDTMIVNVTAKPNAGPDQTICEYTTAALAAIGTGTWSTPATGNPSATTITIPSSATTTVTGFTAAGAYYYIWTVNDCTDTMIVNVTAKPNAGPDQTICEYTTTTLAGAGTGTWSTPATGNPSATTITTPSSATTTVTGFTAAGAYSYIWTVNGCTDTMIVHVTAKPNAGTDQTICEYTTATLAATGTGTWSTPATGNPSATTITIPSSATTTVTGFTAAGAYSYIWTVNGCTDTMIVNVTAKPNAGADQTICEYTTTTLAAIGTGTWSTPATGNPSATTITTPSSATTTVTGFTAAGAYYYIWTVNGCTDTMIVNVTAKPDAGPDQTICEYTTATMAGVGTGTWSTPATGNPSATTITTPSSGTTTVTGFTAAGAYSYIWTVNGCSDTMIVNVTAKPNAGADQMICEYTTATLAAIGTGTWSTPATGNPSATTITTPSSATTTVTGFTAAGAYSYIWTVNGCTDTMIVHVTAKPNAGTDQTICEYTTATLAATGTGTWSTPATGNPSATTITTPSSATTTVTGFTAAGAYSFIWTSGGCTDTMIVNVTAKPNAGADQTICEYTTATLAGVGTGTWSTPATGNPSATTITTPSSGTTTVTGFTAAGAYYYIWTVNGCTDTMIVNVTAKPNAGADQTICEYTTATMAGAGTGTWSTPATGNPSATTITTPSSATTTVTGFTSAGAYSYIWTVNGCTDTMIVNVTAKPNAGADQMICEYTTATLAGAGTGTWSTPATGNPSATTITTPSSATTTVTGFTAAGAYYYIWTVNGCTDTMIVNVTAKPDAGPDQTICEYTTATMAGVGTGTWSTPATGNPSATTITTPSSGTTTVTGFTAAGAYSYIWTVNGCSDTMIVNVTAKPNAGADQTICEYTTATLAGVGTGTWSTPATGNPSATTITTPSSGTTTVTGFTGAGTYYYIWTVNGCSDTMIVNVTAKPNAGADQTICEYTTASLTATGTGTWSTPATGNPAAVTITTPASPTTSVTGFTVAGAYSFIWTSGGCTDTMIVNVTAKPNAGADQIICQYTSATMAGVGTGIWSAPATGNPSATTITTPSSATTNITGFSVAGAYTFIWTVNGCTDTMIVNVTAKPNAGADQTICEYTTATLAATGTGTWSTPATGNPSATTITTPSSGTTTVTGFTAAGAYSYIWTVNGCSDTMIVNVTAKPDAGADQTICEYTTATLAGAGTGTWSTPATGNPSTTAITTPSSATTTVTGFSAAGTYYYIWTVNGCTDTMTINVTAKPDAGPDQVVCQFTQAVMSASGTGTWTALNTNPSATVITNGSDPATVITGFDVSGGVYSFIWTSSGCTDTVTVTATPKPDAGPDQNICQDATATMAGVGAAGLWSALPSNPTVASITNPTQGNTTIFALTSLGIYSFVWTVNGCSDTVDLYINAQPAVSVADTVVCQSAPATLTAQPTIAGGSYLWSTTDNTQAITVYESCRHDLLYRDLYAGYLPGTGHRHGDCQ